MTKKTFWFHFSVRISISSLPLIHHTVRTMYTYKVHQYVVMHKFEAIVNVARCTPMCETMNMRASQKYNKNYFLLVPLFLSYNINATLNFHKAYCMQSACVFSIVVLVVSTLLRQHKHSGFTKIQVHLTCP